MVRLFHTRTTSADPCTCGIEMIAAAAALRLGNICIVLEVISFLVVAFALMSEPRGNDSTLLLFSARALYVLSFITLVAAISAGVLFMTFRV